MPTPKSTERARKSLAKGRKLAGYEREQAAIDAAGAESRWTPEQRAEKDRHRTDHRYFVESCLWVPHIDGGQITPFELNAGQSRAADLVAEIQERGDPVRIICLKSRKWGFSTFCQALAYQFTSTREYVNALVLAHVKEKTADILELTKKFHMLDERRALGMRPMLERSSKSEMKFGNPDPRTRELYPGLQSTIEVTSAEAKEPGRSGTYQFVHASEVAFWPEDSAKKGGIWVAIGNALMEAPDTIAFMESTANGAAGLFHETWENACEGKNEWTPLFLGWLDDVRCRRPLTPDERRVFDYLSKQERAYAEKYKLTPEQVKFRRQMLASPKMRKPGRTPESVFDEEYPASPEVAFQSSGRLYFLVETLEALKRSPTKGERPPIWRGTIRNRDGLEARGPHNPRHPIDPVLEDDPSGPLRIWEQPRKDCEYIVAADIAEGLVHGDNHCIPVLRRDNLDVVAVWKTNEVTSRQAGQAACLLGWYYGGLDIPALVGIELNAHGIAAAQEAVRILYPNLWHHTDIRKEGDKPQDRVGWLTTEAVRPYMLDTLEFEIRDGKPGLHHSEFYKEASTFENVDGKPQARVGKKDDEIMATAILLQLHMHAGPPRRVPDPNAGATPGRRVLTPDWPENGKVPISQSPGRLRRVNAGSLWGED